MQCVSVQQKRPRGAFVILGNFRLLIVFIYLGSLRGFAQVFLGKV